MKKWLPRIFKRQSKADKQREALMEIIKKATAQSLCVIRSAVPGGVRVTVPGKDTMTRQLEEIAKEKGIII